MRNSHLWQPSKFIYRNGSLRASRNQSEVSSGSRLVADIVASFYEIYLPVYATGRLIDLGCGSVPLFQAYRDNVTSVVCVDWRDTPAGYLDHQCDLTDPLPFGHGEFDTIILSDVLEHIPTPTTLWQEMARILAPGGCLIMNVPFFYWLHDIPHDYYRYSEYALRRFARENGLDIAVLRTIGGSPEVLADLLAKHFQHLPLIGTHVAAAVQSLTLWSSKLRLVRRISEQTAQVFPLGYFMVAKKPTLPQP